MHHSRVIGDIDTMLVALKEGDAALGTVIGDYITRRGAAAGETTKTRAAPADTVDTAALAERGPPAAVIAAAPVAAASPAPSMGVGSVLHAHNHEQARPSSPPSFFPLDYAVSFYQGKARTPALVYREGGMMGSPTSSGPSDALDGESTKGTVHDGGGVASSVLAGGTDIISLHCLLQPPDVSGEAGHSSGCAGGDGSSGKSSPTARYVGYALMESNWAVLLPLLLPTIDRLEPATAALLLRHVDASDVASARYGGEVEKSMHGENDAHDETKLVDGCALTYNPKSQSPISLAPSSSPWCHCLLSLSGWKALRYDDALMDRWHYSYTCVLRFYGWRLHDGRSGEIDRHRDWRARYAALRPRMDITISQYSDIASVADVDYYQDLTYVLRVLLEMKMPQFAAKMLRHVAEEGASGRLLFLFDDLCPSPALTAAATRTFSTGLYDRVWAPMLAAFNKDGFDYWAGGGAGSDIAAAAKARRRIGHSDSE